MPSEGPENASLEMFQDLSRADRKAVERLLSTEDRLLLRRALFSRERQNRDRKRPPAARISGPAYSSWLATRLKALADEGSEGPGAAMTPATRAFLAEWLEKSETPDTRPQHAH